MIATLLSPETAPFAVALALMLMIAAAEIVSFAFGAPVSGAIDSLIPGLDVDLDGAFDHGSLHVDAEPSAHAEAAAGPFSQFLSWLCVGKVPVLILFVLFLTAFGLAGLLLQGFAGAVFGAPLAPLLAVLPAFAAALPATRASGLLFSRILPKEHSEAVSQKRFVGKIALITQGTARRGLPAEGRLKDSYGAAHYVRIEPDVEGAEFPAGSEVLIVGREGSVFRAVRSENAAMRGEAAGTR